MKTAPELAGWDCHVHVFDADAPVLAGHYRPPTRTLAEIESRAAAAGVGHLVLVQPSVYGSDNGLMLQALRAGQGHHRGVAVVAAEVSDAELDALHAAGVRGIRFNQVSPVGASSDPAALLHRLAPRLQERGWHVQWYLHAAGLPALLPLQRQTGLVFVLDHLAGIAADTPTDAPAWSALAALAAGGAWLKLSGWYRLQAQAPYRALHAPLQRAAGLFGRQLLWGSDWPHTSLGQAPDLPYDATWQPVHDALDPTLAQALRCEHPWRLYR
ncbi:amidohydrolase family protein [Aquabacterium sp.]|uniref:amidohydrolase family protein n=1 Tax=Aquabacterium sp. TaxID=1872578 RepID=UPI002D043C42|nr:amidohydrolase family protein [Aquabacterium sp.]HSW08111.1 amidohydrolase family protein [Aquabacterium sp.]